MPSDIILKDNLVEVIGGIAAKKTEAAEPFVSMINTAGSARVVVGGGNSGTTGEVVVSNSEGNTFFRVSPGVCQIGSNTITLKSGSRVRLESSGLILDLGPSDIKVTKKSGSRKSFDLIKTLESIERMELDVRRLKAQR